MKNLLILFSCLSLQAPVLAQTKYEYGPLIKAGSFTLPAKINNKNSAFDVDKQYFIHKPGSTYTLGIWQSLSLGDQWSVSGELLFRFSSFKAIEQFSSSWNGGSHRLETTHFKENGLSIPIKLHYTFKKGGKSSFAIGGGISRVLNSSIYIKTVRQTYPSAPSTSFRWARYSNRNPYTNQLSFNAAYYYRINSSNSIGLEYTFEKTRDGWNPVDYLPPGPRPEPILLVAQENFKPNMSSFSVSLRHNLLD